MRPRQYAVVVGGANVDIKVRTLAPVVADTSNPGRASMSDGGVARNVAENLARLGTPTHLVAAVGCDQMGDRLLAGLRSAGVLVDHVQRSDRPTGTYIAVLDHDGELVVAVSDMTATDEMPLTHVAGCDELVRGAEVLVVDANVRVELLRHLLDVARVAEVRTVVDPVSVPKATRLTPILDAARAPMFAITPNRDELAAIAGAAVPDDGALVAAAAELHGRGVEHVWVRLGERGSLFSSGDAGHVFVDAVPTVVRDVTGAGDAMLAAFVHALLTGRDPVDAVRFGHAAAALTVASTSTVRPDLTARLVERVLDER